MGKLHCINKFDSVTNIFSLPFNTLIELTRKKVGIYGNARYSNNIVLPLDVSKLKGRRGFRRISHVLHWR